MKTNRLPVGGLLTLVLGLALLALPLLVLLAAGLAWLFERGWLLGWLVGATAIAAVIWGAQRWRTWRLRRRTVEQESSSLTAQDPDWAPRERAAWATVISMSSRADAAALTDRDRLLSLGRETIDAVAHHYHPDRDDPALQFTLPELLLLTEQVSARLRRLLIEHVPFSDRISARQIALAWGYRPALQSAVSHGRRVYAVMRVARAVSPLNALLAELRDRMVDELYGELSTQVRRRIVRMWIEEVGRAAIDLYSGRLRVDRAAVEQQAAAETLDGLAAAAGPPGALRLLVTGRTKAGKSTVINALLGNLAAGVDALPMTREFVGYQLSESGQPALVLIDSPGIEDSAGAAALLDRAAQCDLILWVVAAHRPGRARDRETLDALRAMFAQDTSRRMPPVLVALTHIDRLKPAREWEPPYDLESRQSAKARTIRAALEAAAEDLDVPVNQLVPVRLDADPPYNLTALKLLLAASFDDARRARWLRLHAELAEQHDWRRLLRQLLGTGRVLGALIRR